MKMMKQFALVIMVLGLAVSAASAQIAAPPVPSIIPPPPAPSAPPPPKIEVPEVPKMDQPPPKAKAAQPRRTSFHDRVINCLSDDTAARLTPGDRAAYSRACANGQY